MPHTLWTIGHSIRPIGEFINLLQVHTIQRLIDVRTIPRSRHNPQFNADALAHRLNGGGIDYQQCQDLGGLRKPRPDSVNTGWRNASFRGYADYMQTDRFYTALGWLMTTSEVRTTVIMCAEAVPWRCHRSLIADALLSHGWMVRHIMSSDKAEPHRMTAFAVIDQANVTYPGPTDATGPPQLF